MTYGDVTDVSIDLSKTGLGLWCKDIISISCFLRTFAEVIAAVTRDGNI